MIARGEVDCAEQRDVLELPSTEVVENPIWNHRPQVGVASAGVEVEPTVVVEITELAPHGEVDLVGAADTRRDVLEGAVALVAEESRLFRLRRLAGGVREEWKTEIFSDVRAPAAEEGISLRAGDRVRRECRCSRRGATSVE